MREDLTECRSGEITLKQLQRLLVQNELEDYDPVKEAFKVAFLLNELCCGMIDPETAASLHDYVERVRLTTMWLQSVPAQHSSASFWKSPPSIVCSSGLLQVYDPNNTGFADPEILRNIFKQLDYGDITDEDLQVRLSCAGVVVWVLSSCIFRC